MKNGLNIYFEVDFSDWLGENAFVTGWFERKQWSLDLDGESAFVN